jgi:hypothetical protein
VLALAGFALRVDLRFEPLTLGIRVQDEGAHALADIDDDASARLRGPGFAGGTGGGRALVRVRVRVNV